MVTSLVEKASRHDVIKLVPTYEAGIYGNSRLQSTNGYEVRRRNALAEVTSARLKAAAAASAIALVAPPALPIDEARREIIDGRRDLLCQCG